MSLNNTTKLVSRSETWNNFKFVDYLDITKKEINNLPDGISVSTMCASCKLNTRLDIPNIEKFLQLNTDDVITVKKDKEKMKTLIQIKNKPKRTKKTDIKVKNTSTNHFYNQVTVVIRVDDGEYYDLNECPRINMKLFKNGSVQMSGCKSLYNINRSLNKLIYRLKEVKAKMEDGTIVEKKFIENANNITISDFKIDMINSNYQVNMQIDRDKLFGLLLKKKIKSSYEPCIRACVIIKFVPNVENTEQKEVSVFVFQRGNIIITGARTKSHIISAYNYMNDILLTHTDEIIKKDDDDDEIMLLGNDILKQIDSGLIVI
jgi:TATA-box binding protein (TBP) (component of TFIID and TFIIIB)